MTMRRYRCLSGSTADWQIINLDWTNLWARGGVVETDDELAWDYLASDGYEDITDLEVPNAEAPVVEAPAEEESPEAPEPEAPEAPEEEEEAPEDVEIINKVVEPAKEQSEVETVEAVKSADEDGPETITKAPRRRSKPKP